MFETKDRYAKTVINCVSELSLTFTFAAIPKYTKSVNSVKDFHAEVE